MSTALPSHSLETALSSIPKKLRERLSKNFSTLKNEALEGHHDTIGHQAGKLAEVIIRITQHIVFGSYTPLSSNIGNFKNECEKLENAPKAAASEGVRLLIPRALLFLYSLRNKRDFGHVGGEVDANEIDALTAIRVADWCICELIRNCHNIPLEEAQKICDAIAERKLPVVWSVLGRKRVLDTSLSYRDQTLLLLYGELEEGIASEDLFEWVGHSHHSNYRRDVLGRLHDSRLVEWDKETEMVIISPTGISEVEKRLLKKYKTTTG